MQRDGAVVELVRRLNRASREVRRAHRGSRLRPRVEFDAGAPAMLLSPHCDDAVLSCWSVLSGGGELAVLNVFAGTPRPGPPPLWDRITGASDSPERARERRAEDAEALARAGRQGIDLGLLDAQYSRRGPQRLDRLDAAVAAAAPRACLVYAPAGIGAHPDHLLARRYARLLAAHAGVPVALYAELPYCVLHGWPHWVDGRSPDPMRDVDAHWSSFLGEVRGLEQRLADVHRLDDAQAAAKLEAMRCYRTQLPALSYGGRDLLCDPEIHRFEVRWRLRGPRPAPNA